MPKKTRRAVLSEDRDLPMLMFIWRWKVATTAVLHRRFFNGYGRSRTYHRLYDLEKAGFVKSTCDATGLNFAWMLERRGFNAIRSELPALKEEGCRSENIRHDLLAAAFQYGDWIPGQPESVHIISEQQLRRYAEESRPHFIPKSNTHRPDGFTYFRSEEKSRLIAFEVELNQKCKADYFDPGLYYAYDEYARGEQIYRVLWLANGLAFSHRLDAMMRKEGGGNEIHNFVLLDHFEKMGWKAPIVIGPEKGQTVVEFLKSQLAGQKPEESTWEDCSHLWLDGRKSFVKPKPSATSPNKGWSLLTPYWDELHEEPVDPNAFLAQKIEGSYLPSTSSTSPGLQTDKES